MAALFAQSQPQYIQQAQHQPGAQYPASRPTWHNVPQGAGPAGQMDAKPMQMQYVQEATYQSVPPSAGEPGATARQPLPQQQQGAGPRRGSEGGLQNAMPNMHERPARPSIAIPGSEALNMIPERTSPTTAWNTYTSPERPALLEAVSPTDHKHLFNAYIYDYLYKQGYQDAARAFLLNAPDTPIKRGKVGGSSIQAAAGPRNGSGSEQGRFAQGHNGHVDATDLHTGNAESSTARHRTATSQDQQMQNGMVDLDEEDDSNDLQINGGGDAADRGQSRQNRHRTGGAPGTADSDKSDHTVSSATSSRFGGTSKESNTTNGTSVMSGDPSKRLSEGDLVLDMHNRSSTPPLSSGLFGTPSTTKSKTPRMATSGSNAEQPETMPEPDVQITAPNGFLFEWWSVFWDIFRARGEKGGSPAAKAYYQVAQNPAALPTRYGQPIRQPGYSLPPGFEDAGAIAAQQLSAHHQQQMQQQAVMRGTMQPQRAASVAGPASAIEAPIKTEQNQQQSDSIVASPSGQGQGQNKPSPTNTAQPVNVPQRTASMPVLGQQQQSATPQMQQHQAVAQGSGPQQVQMVNGQPQIIQTLQYRGPPQQNAMGPQQIQQVQGVQGQPVGYPPGMVQIQGARTAVPAGQAQRRYAVSGAPPGFAPQAGQPGLVYRQGGQPVAQPHVRIVSGPGGHPHLQQTNVIAGPPGQHIQYVQQGVQPPHGYVQVARPGHPGQQVVYQQQQQPPHPSQSPYMQQQQAPPQQVQVMQGQQRPGLLPQHVQQQHQGQMPPQQHQLAGKGRPPSVAGQRGPENMSSPGTMPSRAPSRTAAASPYHPQQGDIQMQQQHAAMQQQQRAQTQGQTPADHESPMRRPGEATPPEGSQQHMQMQQQQHQQRLMEQQRQAQAGSPHSSQQQPGQMQQVQPQQQQPGQEVYKQPMQPRPRAMQQHPGQPGMVAQSPVPTGQDAAFSPHAGQPVYAGQPGHPHQQLFRPASGMQQQQQQPNGMPGYEQQQQYWQQQHQQQHAIDGPSPQLGPSPRPEMQQQGHMQQQQRPMQNGQGPPYAEIQDAISRHPQQNGMHEQQNNMPPPPAPAANGAGGRRQAVFGASGQMPGAHGAGTPGAASAPTPNGYGQPGVQQQGMAQASPDVSTSHSQPATPRTPSTATTTTGPGPSGESAAGPVKGTAKGRKRNATEAVGAGPAKETKKARATRSNTASSAAAASAAAAAAADVAVPDPPSEKASAATPAQSQQQQYEQSAQQRPNGVQSQQPQAPAMQAQQSEGNIAVPVQQYQQQGQQPQDIIVNGSMDFTDLSQFGIDSSNITFDPNAFTMLDDSSLDFEQFLNWQ